MNKLLLLTLSLFTSPLVNADTTIDIDAKPQPGTTLIWSPLFQATWDQLNKECGGVPYEIIPKNPLATKLDHFKWDEKAVLPAGHYATYSGPSTEAFLQQTKQKVRQRFGFNLPTEDVPLNDEGKTCFGVLVRALQFKRMFYQSKNKPLTFTSSNNKKSKVHFFGTKGKATSKFRYHVDVHCYKEEGKEFLLAFDTKQKGERLVIYKPNKKATIRETITQAHTYLSTPLKDKLGALDDGYVHRLDSIKIPYLNFIEKAKFRNELRGLRYVKGVKRPWRCVMAFQETRFELTHKGAKVRVVAGSSMDPFGGPIKPPEPPKYIPRQFHCDRHFYVFLWKDNAKLPYLSISVDGADKMKKWQK